MKNAHYQAAAWSAFAAIVFVTVSPIQMRPGDLLSVDVDRALAFGALATIFMVAYPRHALKVGLFVVVLAGATEALQLLSPTRHARFDDALIKGAGAVGGMALAFFYNALRVKRHARRAQKHGATARPQPAQAGMIELPVTATMIQSVYFSPQDGRLRIRMHDGEERLFQGVRQEDAEALVAAPSPDQHYIEEITARFSRAA
ncbi:KTSC domain-containing protein [Rhizobium sp.]